MAARVRAPELAGRGGWVGTDGPLSLAALRGKVVLLDFWTFCCINCLRVLEELRPLEERFADVLVVVGIHSPKFPHEGDHAAVEQATARHRVTHPVLDDPDLATWRQYGARGWPTLVLVDPEGYAVAMTAGEGQGAELEREIERLVAMHEAKGTLVRGPLPAHNGAAPGAALAFPGKVAVSPDGRRLAIADTGHDRILVTDLGGRVLRGFGGFHQPQGVRFVGNGRLVVCDTAANVVVAVDLVTGERRTVLAELASPWDVLVEPDGSLVVAEAGRHRLWRIARDGSAAVAAGTGDESILDGPAADALLAQPSGLTRLPDGVAFADSEVSALRVLTDDGRVVTLAGAGLFEWGAADGPPTVARLQHPLGVAATADGQAIYVADTFNSRLRVWRDGELHTLAVRGLDEPGGLDLLPDGRLVVADTNHHRVVVVDPALGTIGTLPIDESWVGAADGGPLAASAGGPVAVGFSIDLDGLVLDTSSGAPVHVRVRADPPALLGDGPRVWELSSPWGSVDVPAGRRGTGVLLLDATAAVCHDDRCDVRADRRRFDLTVS